MDKVLVELYTGQEMKGDSLQPCVYTHKYRKKNKKKNTLFDDLRNRRSYWEIKVETEDLKRWKQQFINRT